MKRTLLFAALVASTSLAFAEPPPGPSRAMHQGGPPIEMLTKDLGLNETQQAEVKRIFDAQHAKMETERAQFESSGTRPTREEMDARRELRDTELNAQLAAVLTADQLARFEEMRKRRPMRARGEHGQQAPQ